MFVPHSRVILVPVGLLSTYVGSRHSHRPPAQSVFIHGQVDDPLPTTRGTASGRYVASIILSVKLYVPFPVLPIRPAQAPFLSPRP
jgi:hypothetical protein